MADIDCNDSVLPRDDGSNLEHLAYAAASLCHSPTAAAELPIVPTLRSKTPTPTTMLMSSNSTAQNMLQPLSQFQPTHSMATSSNKPEYILPHAAVLCTKSTSSSVQTLCESSSSSFASMSSSNMATQLLSFNNCSNMLPHSVSISSQSSGQATQNIISSQIHQPITSLSNFSSRNSLTPDPSVSSMYHCATPALTSVTGILDPPSYVYMSTEHSHQVESGASISTTEYGTTRAHSDNVTSGHLSSSNVLINICTVGDAGLPPLLYSCPTMTSTMQHQLPQSVFTTALRPSTNVLPTSFVQQTSHQYNNNPVAIEMPSLALDSNYAVSLGSPLPERGAVETSDSTKANTMPHRTASIPISIGDSSAGQYVRLTKANTSMLMPTVMGSTTNQLGTIQSQHLILHPSQSLQSFPLQASSRSLPFLNYATPNSSGTTYPSKGGQLLTINPNTNTILVHPLTLNNITNPSTSGNVSTNQVLLRTSFVQQPTTLIHDGKSVLSTIPTTCVQHSSTQGMTINNSNFNVLSSESLLTNEVQVLVHQSDIPEQFRNNNNPYDLSCSPLPSRTTRQVQANDSQAELYDQARDLNTITPDFNPDQSILISELGSSNHHGTYDLVPSSYSESTSCVALTNVPPETLVDGVKILSSVSEAKIPMHCSSATNSDGGGEAIHYVDARGIEQQTNETCLPNSLPVAGHGTHHTVDASAQTVPQGSFPSDSLIVYNPDATLMQEAKPYKNVSRDKKSAIEGNSQNSTQSRDRLVMAAEMPDPEPMLVDGKNTIFCPLCDAVFSRMYLYKRHAIVHIGEKRGFLTMNNKIDIITRAKAGERHIDLAMEYNVGRSTLTAIIKNSQKYLDLEKAGNFSGERKRLRGAKREDVEEALYLWYRQAVEMNLPISGPKLCQKAKDFAAKLGYKEFKATHGWLDRFKHRKHITLSRTKTIKESMPSYSSSSLGDDGENQRDFASALPGLLTEFDSNDVFYADEVGLLFTVLPDECSRFQGIRCSGGALSANRLTLLVCANMTSTEKFPLLVVGRYSKPQNSETLRSLPVQYFFNGKAWITQDHFNLWLTDIDSWFVKHNRKVLFLIPISPVHPKNISLNAIKIMTTPASFKGPVKQGISKALKQHYRRSVLELNVDNLHTTNFNRYNSPVSGGVSNAGYSKKMHPVSLLQALVFLSSAWQNVSVTTITNSFTKAGFSKFGPWSVNALPDCGLATDNLELLYCLRETGFSIPSSLTFNDYVTFDDDVQTCRLMDDDDVIAIVSKKQTPSSDSETELDSGDMVTPAQHNKTEAATRSPHHASASNTSSKNNRNEPLGSPSPIQTSALLHSLKVLQSHVQKKAARCPELSPVFARLEELVLEKLTAKSRKESHGSSGVASAASV